MRPAANLLLLLLLPPGADAEAAELLARIRLWLDTRPGELVRWLDRHDFASSAAALEDTRVDPTSKYRLFLYALVASPNDASERIAWWALGNRLFEYCFGPATNGDLRALLASPTKLPLVRLLYEGISYGLARTGWSHWHADTLAALRREADAGREVVYVAGGTDVLQLLRAGVRRLRVIDPMLPTQARYYSEGWEYLLRGRGDDGGLGDLVLLEDGLRMERTAYRVRGAFATAVLSDGRRATLPESTTAWTLSQEGVPRGRVVFERRFARQDDFVPERALVLSFNELYFVATAGPKSWGIDPTRFAPALRLHVKQLRRPVGRATLLNLRAAESRLPYAFGTAVD